MSMSLNLYYDEVYSIFNNRVIDALDVGYLVLLGKFINTDNGYLLNEDGDYMTISDMVRVLKGSDSTIKRFVKRMIEVNVIFSDKNENDVFKRKNKYLINPCLLSSGVCKVEHIQNYDLHLYKHHKKVLLTEHELEKYLVDNIHVIEEGMAFVDRQVKVDNGIIDILARDKNSVLCIIELKVKSDDQRLVEQCKNYRTNFSQKLRMISVCPDYTDKIYHKLVELKTEIKQYVLLNNEIVIQDFIA